MPKTLDKWNHWILNKKEAYDENYKKFKEKVNKEDRKLEKIREKKENEIELNKRKLTDENTKIVKERKYMQEQMSEFHNDIQNYQNQYHKYINKAADENEHLQKQNLNKSTDCQKHW